MSRTAPIVAALLLVAGLSSCAGTPLQPDFQVVLPPAPPPITFDNSAPSIPTFGRPFVGQFNTLNVFDHQVPLEATDNNGSIQPFWADESFTVIAGNWLDGHNGYDWAMPAGTQIVAVAPGRVVFAGTAGPFFCRAKGVTVTNQVEVGVEHVLSDGTVVRSWYVHLSQVASGLTVGRSVTLGQQIGLSGKTGCAIGDHLHFEVRRQTTGQFTDATRGAGVSIDPYGWTGAFVDPWKATAGGAESINLWKPNAAPPLYRETAAVVPPGFNSGITRVRWMGVSDKGNPNNEFVEISRTSTANPGDVFVVVSLSGNNFNWPVPTDAATLSASNPVIRVFTGSGTTTASNIYMGKTAGVWDNSQDCVRATFKNGRVYQFPIGGSTCQLGFVP